MKSLHLKLQQKIAERKNAVNELEIQQKGWKKFTARVLVADDNPVNQEISRAMLKNLGCQVDVVTNGEEVLEALTKARYDLIFMDCRMSEIEGYGAVRAIRESENAQNIEQQDPASDPVHIPIVAFTDHRMQNGVKEYPPSGTNDYLRKPFSPDQMAAVLNRWVPRKSSQNEPRLPSSFIEARSEFDALEMEICGPPIDSKIWGRIRELGGKNGKDFILKVADTYLKTSPRYLQALKEAIAGADAKAMQKAAHSFKSSNGNMGALRLTVLCEKLNKMGRANTTRGAAAVLTKIETEYEAVQDALQKELNAEARLA